MGDDELNIPCDRCLKTFATLYFHDPCTEEALCKSCLKLHRLFLKRQIESLPEIDPCLAPLGYRFIYKYWFKSEFLGRQEMNLMWKKSFGFTA